MHFNFSVEKILIRYIYYMEYVKNHTTTIHLTYADIFSLTLKEGMILSILPTYLVPRKQEHIL